jgi:hypothetical protein
MKCRNCNADDAWPCWCEFCDKQLCEKCVKSSDFGHVCSDCGRKVEEGVIDDAGVEHKGKS